jgi:hypothetical protein
MSRAQRLAAASPAPAPAPGSPSWPQWPLKVQTLQLDAATDMLGVFSRYVAALAAARDARALGEAQRTLAAGWTACIEDAQRQWAELARLAPPEAWSSIGWRLKPSARAASDSAAREAPCDLFEQSKLGIEMLLRPWMAAPDLDHTDEFVA